MERGSHDHRHQEEEGGCKMTKRSAHSLSLATSWLLLKNSWRNAKRHTSSLICTHTRTRAATGEQERKLADQDGEKEGERNGCLFWCLALVRSRAMHFLADSASGRCAPVALALHSIPIPTGTPSRHPPLASAHASPRLPSSTLAFRKRGGCRRSRDERGSESLLARPVRECRKTR